MYKDIAINIVKELRRNNIPAYIHGGVAVDILSGEDRKHKDIDIYVPNYSYSIYVRKVMKNLGFVLKIVNQPHREFYQKGNIGVDIFYGALYFGKFKPNPDKDSLVVDKVSLIESIYDKYERYKEEVSKALRELQMLSEV